MVNSCARLRASRARVYYRHSADSYQRMLPLHGKAISSRIAHIEDWKPWALQLREVYLDRYVFGNLRECDCLSALRSADDYWNSEITTLADAHRERDLSEDDTVETRRKFLATPRPE